MQIELFIGWLRPDRLTLGSLQPLQTLLNHCHVLLLLLRGEHMKNLVAQLEPVHHAFGGDVGNLPGHLIRFILIPPVTIFGRKDLMNYFPELSESAARIIVKLGEVLQAGINRPYSQIYI